jgi:hypothetical protein
MVSIAVSPDRSVYLIILIIVKVLYRIVKVASRDGRVGLRFNSTVIVTCGSTNSISSLRWFDLT